MRPREGRGGDCEPPTVADDTELEPWLFPSRVSTVVLVVAALLLGVAIGTWRTR
jgi:hypothetical protein